MSLIAVSLKFTASLFPFNKHAYDHADLGIYATKRCDCEKCHPNS